MADGKLNCLISFASAAGLLVLAGCDRRAPDDAVPAGPPPVEAEGSPSPALPLSRADLIAGAAAAAGAHALGVTPGEGDPLVGRSFSVSLPFGCGGPRGVGSTGGPAGLARAAWQGEERDAILLDLTPADLTAAPLIAQADGRWEAVEGYWIDRPWLLEDRCPTVRTDALNAGIVFAEPPSVGLAAVHEAGASRLGRRDGRAHRHVVRGAGEAAPVVPADGWRVRLEGRVLSFPDGRAFRCRATSPDARPTCVAAVSVDRVAFETPEGVVLSQWRPG